MDDVQQRHEAPRPNEDQVTIPTRPVLGVSNKPRHRVLRPILVARGSNCQVLGARTI